ncbi:DUF5597 domain-containing protein [Candidatus Bathyarchaeota archaeon]|nr:DUF5597 domain-containing protein [Candidatus Bathyarchaeota archaeon]
MNESLSNKIPHLHKKGDTTQLFVDGEPFIMLGGELHNSSSSSLAYMESIWPRLVSLGLNTVLAPVSWELVEPVEGKLDFTLVDGLIEGARKHNLKLVFLWFGTWKNASSSYAPPWVKTNLERFPRAQTSQGKNTDAVTCFSRAACEADAHAFAALMRHICEVDGQEHTVLMLQVENEVGILRTTRDRCELAERAFAQDVPTTLTDYIREHANCLTSYLQNAWKKAGSKTAGTWKEVFGEAADEVFMAWHFARYINSVAKAGKAEYPIPMYVNAWLGPQYEGQLPGSYPSGGPVARMMDIWRVAAPNIDFLAPDIYVEDFRRVCCEFRHSGNPLMIPEARSDEQAAGNVFYAVGQHDALCFSPFAIDSVVEPHPLTASYRLLSEMMPIITKYQGTGRMIGFTDDSLVNVGYSAYTGRELRGFECELGRYQLQVHFTKPFEKGKVPASGIIIATRDDEYIVAGLGFTVTFASKPKETKNVEILTLDEGRFEKGKWVAGRRLNGDESLSGKIIYMRNEPSVCIAKIYEYP